MKNLFKCTFAAFIVLAFTSCTNFPFFNATPIYPCVWNDTATTYINNVNLGLPCNIDTCQHPFSNQFLENIFPAYSFSFAQAMDCFISYRYTCCDNATFSWTSTVMGKTCNTSASTKTLNLNLDNYSNRLIFTSGDKLEGTPAIQGTDITRGDLKIELTLKVSGVTTTNGETGTIAWQKTWLNSSSSNIIESFPLADGSWTYILSTNNSPLIGTFIPTRTNGPRRIYIHDHFETL